MKRCQDYYSGNKENGWAAAARVITPPPRFTAGRIRSGYVYVDKTALMWRLIDTGKYYFLSRPRRFGKSLLLSTFAAYFSGEKDLFTGLAIAEHTTEWPKHPVLHMDLGGQNYTSAEELNEVLDTYLTAWESRYGASPAERSPARRFWGAIRRACEQEGRQVVVLIDEYDKPLLETVDNEPLYEQCRGILRGVYGNLKTCDKYIKFAFLTGVTKLSVFSDLNNLSDISMQREYAAICGITEAELDRYFAPGIEELARQNGMTAEEMRERLKNQYDGYLFNRKAENVYNPFSLLNAFSKNELGDYWFESGTPEFLAEMLKRDTLDPENLTAGSVSPSRLNALDSLSDDPLPILYQSGYLTLASAHPLTGNYKLKFPNEEVERGFFNMLLPLYTHKGTAQADPLLDRLVTGLAEGDPEGFMRELQALLADIPYERGKPVEAYFRNLVFIVFRLVGFYCEVEHPMAGGRSDTVVKTDKFIYVLELKVDQSAEAALSQIEEKGYAAPYAADSRKLCKLGVNFSTKSKRIDEWRSVEA